MTLERTGLAFAVVVSLGTISTWVYVGVRRAIRHSRPDPETLQVLDVNSAEYGRRVEAIRSSSKEVFLTSNRHLRSRLEQGWEYAILRDRKGRKWRLARGGSFVLCRPNRPTT